ncbi:hypothetical protein [Nostoc sp.]|uniref:hypothetical protein n=1 Tax=Nostoc sp. TaxID=1180 RepID=UPI002FF6523B
MNNQQPEYKQVFDDFWKEIVCDENGKLKLDQVQRELFDYWVAIQNVPKVYCQVTGGLFSKLNTDASYVIDAAEERYSKLYEGGDCNLTLSTQQAIALRNFISEQAYPTMHEQPEIAAIFDQLQSKVGM